MIGRAVVRGCRGDFAPRYLPRAFLPPFNEGTVLSAVMLQPGICLAESQPRRPDCRDAHPGKCRKCTPSDAAPAAPNSTSTPRVSTPARLDVDLNRSERSRERGPGRHPRASLHAAGQPSMSGSRSRIVSTTCSPACARRSLSRSTATTSTPCAASPPSMAATRWPASTASSICRSRSRCAFPQLQVRVDYDKAGVYGLTPALVTEALETLSTAASCRRSSTATAFDVVLRARRRPTAPPKDCDDC